MSERFSLITGRTSRQGRALHWSKASEGYRASTLLVEMNAEDMARLGVAEGQVVRLRTAAGQAEVEVHPGALPRGLLFVPLGPAASALVGADTEGTGMPLSKGLVVEIELA